MKIKSMAKSALILTCVLALTACGSGSKPQSDNKDTKSTSDLAQSIEKEYPYEIKNEGNVVDGGVLKVGYVCPSPFKGVLNGFLTSDYPDMVMVKPMSGAFAYMNPDFSLKQDDKDAPIDFHVDVKSKTIDLKINPKFKWNNGDTVSSEDIVKTYEILANQKYIMASQSARFGGDMLLIKGIDDYNKGKADKISGLEVKSPSELVVHLTKMVPSALWGGVTPNEFVNAKQLANIPMDKIPQSDPLRKNPLSYGQYYIKSIVPGEKIVYEANPYFYRGPAKVKKLEMSIVPPSQQVEAMKAGKYDVLLEGQKDVFEKFKELKNAKISATPGLSYHYLGFNMGTWDAKNNVVKFNPKAKMSDPALRKAMGYALNIDQVSKKFYHGLAYRLNTIIIPPFEGLSDTSLPGFPQDLDKANKILDEAGYKKGSDGFRTDKDGKPLVINFSMMKGSEINEPLSQNYMQQWKKIGLNVKLVDGRLLDFNDFYQRVENNDPKIDAYIGGWGTGTDPNPTQFFGIHEQFNMGRYENPELTKALDVLSTEACLDKTTREKAYKDFQKVFQEQSPTIPLDTGFNFTLVNNRVKYYDNGPVTTFGFGDIELTAKDPVAQ